MPNCKTIAICNQKGGVGKTTTAVNLGIGLAMQTDEYIKGHESVQESFHDLFLYEIYKTGALYLSEFNIEQKIDFVIMYSHSVGM